MDPVHRKFHAKNTVLVKPVWSSAAWLEEREFLLVAVRFFLLVLQVGGVAMPSIENYVNEPYS